jgi:hypothetical protein
VAALQSRRLRAHNAGHFDDPGDRVKFSVLLLTLLIFIPSFSQETPVYLAATPGTAHASIHGEIVTLSNQVLRSSWRVKDGILPQTFNNRSANRALIPPSTAFVIVLREGRAVTSAEMRVTTPPVVEDLRIDPRASRLSERIPGKSVTVGLEDREGVLNIQWRASLRDGSNYLRQEIVFRATKSDVPISEIRIIDWQLPSSRVVGTVKGSPVVADGIFAAIEDPRSSCSVALQRARCKIERELPIHKGSAVSYSSVTGVAPLGQLRRAFLYYLERERAHPYRTFLHYNSWYDLGYFSRFDEKGALDAVRAFGHELHEKRNVQLSSYLFDDGWDDPSTLWSFNSGFPDGFLKVRHATEQFGAEPGVWMSPWGGYGQPKQMRVEAAKASGLEIMNNGLALSGPKYYKLFRDTCLHMMRDFGVNQFKFDGTGNADRVVPGSEFDSDFDAAIHLIGELRSEKPDIYINLTTGTYPSPFWLQYADSIWRGGEDHDFLGVGSWRQRWITYRDADVYEHVVSNGPLFPLNSLMLHGLIFARDAKNLDTDPANDFRSELRDYFGTGTQLQEMYITPSLLSPRNWDDLAQAANWSRSNADVLVDSHWIGGDPAQGEIYGWASWSPQKGILVLRNPTDQSKEISLKASDVFELPAGAPTSFRLQDPYQEDRPSGSRLVRAASPFRLQMKPFEVRVFEAIPNPKVNSASGTHKTP